MAPKNIESERSFPWGVKSGQVRRGVFLVAQEARAKGGVWAWSEGIRVHARPLKGESRRWG